MYKVIALVAMLMVVFFSEFAYSTDDKYCSIMYAIYGVCSPELVSNYLAHTAPQVYRAPRVIPQVNPSLAIVSSVANSTFPETNAKTKPNVRYTWYWTNDRGWVKGRLVG